MTIRLVIVEPEGAYNLGFIARLVKNFLIDEFYVVNPKCDINEAIKFSAKGSEVIEKMMKITNNFDDAIRDVDLKIATSSIADIKGDLLRKSIRPIDLERLIKDKKVAFIFGRESVGLTREEIAKSDFLLFIPANPEYPVLNLSHAVGIVLYELWRNRDNKVPTVSSEPIKLIDDYSKKITDILVNKEATKSMYLVLKRVLIKGIEDNEEAMTIVRILRKIYVRLAKKENESDKLL
ncbi:tRNA (cytidine-2'-O-)-methyltransferase TrmJ [Sulfolobus acidocaldarius]|uniref:tRNA (cytidine-2'-O-)-methyltransferase TrmJ n=4 Tax=Sulfolobus acidocaldarius TaxID=2285 RepID=TRMJ_SULAC|nr:tRNA (cytidine-2'-O-)-methyltransferase TrmJ [Sulfolobus acidocaldarius]Q4JB16.1 RecName: Full=tRNA (cytidine-2'-O-)-methyltransferase TrmJ; AltName: Full=tRNA (cytidine(32)-2'-O)-methyltransferase; AltName: Full=tRNA Cm32 methyltransferase [Sulfolobus acidocaldarius DSM 639]AAY80013.1 SpoU rRNA methylase [Sulfolobus acidocaldarius DSM 639]AGE70582.1 SpoU rRNA methylase [Sulfolobus acidocaldarius N8]AGE72855.1 SpoU rRNA methylase [Sulfolobus acidocaldarius Ron12/I]ALU29061.1 RNA methyltrans